MRRVFLASLVALGYANLGPALLLPDAWRIEPGWLGYILGASVFFVLIAPFLPLCAAITAYFTTWRLVDRLAVTLALIVGVVGLIACVISLLLSGSWLVFVHGVMLCCAAGAGILMLGRLRRVVMLVLAILGVIAGSAKSISKGQPYCLAISGAGPVSSLADLRGFAFYTAVPDNPHGVLFVQNGAEMRSYSWSPRTARFVPAGRPQVVACPPRAKFLTSLPLI
ncbi:MAG: hypothetical protein Q4G24_09870 [Paracoccus sp. (in: a-proteobacteria)]|uniref:hypothetical protein n=1 Tax=Paracoccus sp. TaxID=267 RepID=UPI0026E0E706|nr:hypothetical protein [Paracoccus sp. (in: a-proteobacteria)]MDO5621764.1 hypothetical protein [Paracoccus sp. (in: a-proteobacteria)]